MRELRESVDYYMSAAFSENTKRAYRGDFQRFDAWCAARGVDSLPTTPELVAAYAAYLGKSGKSVSTIERAVAAISTAHRTKGIESPCRHEHVRRVLAGIRNRNAHKGRWPNRKDALTMDELRDMVDTFDGDFRGLRNRALLLLGFFGAFRRSELVSLEVPDVEFTDEGMEIALRRSKTDQAGEGRAIGVYPAKDEKLCSVTAVGTWIEEAQLEDGPLFRGINRFGDLAPEPLSTCSVRHIVKKAAEDAGLEPDRIGPHSLRAGFVTEAAKAGRQSWEIMRQTGHRSVVVMTRYVREANVFANNPTKDLA